MDFILGLGLQLTDEVQPLLSLKVKPEEAPWFVQVQYETPEIRELGQGLADSNVYSLSVGYETSLTDKLYIFTQLGYAHIDYTVKPNIQTEIVYTRLVSRHHVEGAPIPVTTRPNIGETNGARTEYDLKGSVFGEIGLKFQVSKDWSYSLSYKHFKAEEFWRLYDDSVVADCDCWWQETTQRDLSSFNFIIEYKL